MEVQPPVIVYIYILYLCNQFLSSLVWKWLETGRWFSPGPPVSSTNKTDGLDITELLLKVALITIKQTNNQLPVKLTFVNQFSIIEIASLIFKVNNVAAI